MDMTVMDFIDKAGNTGVMLLLLALFAFYILQKARTDDKRVADAQEASRQAIADPYADAQGKIEQANRAVREREDILIENSMKREEILREESRKREDMLRKEAEKRESILMLNQDKMMESMKAITDALNDIKKSFSGIDSRLEKIERKVGIADE
mgnify:FL=1